jgi:hypothetical protein
MRTFCSCFRFALTINALPSSQADQRNGTRFFHGKFLRHHRHAIFIHRNQFREATDSILAWPPINPIANLEPPDSTTDLNHTYTFTRRPDGKTDIDVVVIRDGKNRVGLGWILATRTRNGMQSANLPSNTLENLV